MKTLNTLLLTLMTLTATSAYAGGGGPMPVCTQLSRTVLNEQVIETYKKDGNTLMPVGKVQLISTVTQCAGQTKPTESLHSEVKLDDRIDEHGLDFKGQISEVGIYSTIELDALKVLNESERLMEVHGSKIKLNFVKFSPTQPLPTLEYVNQDQTGMFFGNSTLRIDHLSAEAKGAPQVLTCGLHNHGLILTIKANQSNKLPRDLNLYTIGPVAKFKGIAKPSKCN